MLTAERLRELLSYDPETGNFTWRVNQGEPGRAGSLAGYRDFYGYWRIRVDRRQYRAHRLVWLYVTGKWPAVHVDHINGVKDDNRLANLREATDAESTRNRGRHRNNTSGFKGVCRGKNGWVAKVRVGARRIYLGEYKTPEEAHGAYCRAVVEHHGEFARVN